MTYKEKYNTAKSWKKKAWWIYLYSQTKRQKHTVRSLAAYFEISTGNVSEAILLGSNYSKIKHVRTREDALKILRTNNV